MEEFQGNNIYYTIKDLRGSIVSSEKIVLENAIKNTVLDQLRQKAITLEVAAFFLIRIF